jgi:hypothetical protein
VLRQDTYKWALSGRGESFGLGTCFALTSCTHRQNRIQLVQFGMQNRIQSVGPI